MARKAKQRQRNAVNWAVKYAQLLIRNGAPPAKAIAKAARHYGIDAAYVILPA